MEADKREEPRGCDTDYPRVGATGTVYRRGDPLMSQHLTDRFQRYALRKRNRRGEGMPREVDRGVERQTGVSGNMP